MARKQKLFTAATAVQGALTGASLMSGHWVVGLIGVAGTVLWFLLATTADVN